MQLRIWELSTSVITLVVVVVVIVIVVSRELGSRILRRPKPNFC